ncbi:MAG: PQQ-like beta-propeller repeat protein [Mariniphaga sp.]|nr:PQQ-like beta-propeller repeat protein [Mariniphaga sp.]
MKQLKTISIKKSHLLILTIIILLINQSCKQEIAQWRGADRNGVYNETSILDEWPESGPELLWTAEGLGNGYAAPSVLNNKVFVIGEIDSMSYLFAYDLKGNLLWKTANGPEFMGEGFSSTYPGARSTPTVIDNLAYITSGTGRIACIETSAGEEQWAVDLVKDFGGSENYFGYSESVVVDDNKVYCFAGGNKINIAAIDRLTGETIWTSEALKDTFAYCSPITVELATRKVLITTSRHNLFAVDCENGETLGTYTLKGYEYDGEHCNSPLYADGFIYFIANDEKGSGAVKLELLDDGETIKEVWSNKKIRNNFHGYIVAGDNLLTTVQGNWLKALDLNNGMVADSVKVTTGSIIVADNKLICYGTNGDVNLINYDQNKFNITGKFKVKEGTRHHFAYPVLDNGVMYIRHGDVLMAYNLK